MTVWKSSPPGLPKQMSKLLEQEVSRLAWHFSWAGTLSHLQILLIAKICFFRLRMSSPFKYAQVLRAVLSQTVQIRERNWEGLPKSRQTTLTARFQRQSRETSARWLRSDEGRGELEYSQDARALTLMRIHFCPNLISDKASQPSFSL